MLFEKKWRLVVSTPLKHISQLGCLFPIYGKIKVMSQTFPNHQPGNLLGRLVFQMSRHCSGTGHQLSSVQAALRALLFAPVEVGEVVTVALHLQRWWILPASRAGSRHQRCFKRVEQTLVPRKGKKHGKSIAKHSYHLYYWSVFHGSVKFRDVDQRDLRWVLIMSSHQI